MVKRISIKGKGADIFFGGEPPAPFPGEAAEAVVEAPAPEAPALPPADTSEGATKKQDSMHASMQERPTRRRESAPRATRSAPHPLAPEILEAIWEDLSQRATITNAFRYTDRELSDLADAIYEIGKRHGVRLSKQEVARLGLNTVLWDYRTRGDASLLGSLAAKRKR